ncbi:MAG: hypothetical protein ACE5FQ_04130 [Thiogranum sp.]
MYYPVSCPFEAVLKNMLYIIGQFINLAVRPAFAQTFYNVVDGRGAGMHVVYKNRFNAFPADVA